MPASRRVIAALSLVAALVVPALTQPARAPMAQVADRYDVVVFRNVMVPMRDGVRLATDVYRPARNGAPVEAKLPAILERTPYNKDGSQGWAQYFVPRGYVAVAQDVRGRYASEGHWRPMRDDVNDGYDTASWIGAQPWSDGGIGTVGIPARVGAPPEISVIRLCAS